MQAQKPVIGIIPFGISRDCSENTIRLLNDDGARDGASLVLIGDRKAVIRGQIAASDVSALQIVSRVDEVRQINGIAHLPTQAVVSRNPLTGADKVDLAATVVAALRHGITLAREGALDGMVILGDPCRPGDRLAAMPRGLLNWLAECWRRTPADPLPSIGEIQTRDGIWHMSLLEAAPLFDIPQQLTSQHVTKGLELLINALGQAGFDKPNIAITSLNPRRAGGRFHGTEESNIVAGPVAACREAGHRIFGPWPLDEMLIESRDGALDGIITLHTEQARVVRTVLQMERAPQVLAGLNIPCVRAVWERQAGANASKDDELQEARQALNMAKLLANSDKPSFRFRGEGRVGTAPPKEPPTAED